MVDQREILRHGRPVTQRGLAAGQGHPEGEAANVGGTVAGLVHAAVGQADLQCVGAGHGKQAVCREGWQVGQHLQGAVRRQQLLAVQGTARAVARGLALLDFGELRTITGKAPGLVRRHALGPLRGGLQILGILHVIAPVGIEISSRDR